MFDYDGVIVDSFDAFVNACMKTAQEFRITTLDSKEAFLRLMEGNVFDTLQQQHHIDPERIPQIFTRLLFHLNDTKTPAAPFPHILDTLTAVCHNAHILIITSNDTNTVGSFLQSQRITCIKEIIGVQEEKSKRKKIQYVKEHFPNTRYLYIGDTLGDMKEAKDAGVTTVAVSWGWHSEKLLHTIHPDVMVHTPEALTHVLLQFIEEKS